MDTQYPAARAFRKQKQLEVFTSVAGFTYSTLSSDNTSLT